MFVLFSAPFYPVTVFPPLLQAFAKLMPYTATFENTRSFVLTGGIDYSLLAEGLIVSFAYLAAAVPLYFYAFRRARKTGYIVRMGM